MADLRAINVLMRKRAELGAQVTELDRQTQEVVSQIAHVDACLALIGFDGDPNDIAPIHPQHGRVFARGQLQRLVLAVLREAEGPMTYRQIATGIVDQLNWDREDRDAMASLIIRVRHTMKRLRRRGLIPARGQ